MHEMGEIKRAQEQKVDGVSVQKLRENHETIQQLTSQLQEMQEQIKRNISGDRVVQRNVRSGFRLHSEASVHDQVRQEIGGWTANDGGSVVLFCCLHDVSCDWDWRWPCIFLVTLHCALHPIIRLKKKNRWILCMILEIFKKWNQKEWKVVSRFKSTCDDSEFSLCINLEYRENVFGNEVSTSDSPRDFPQRIQSDDVQRNREAVPEAGRMKTIHTSEDRLNQGTIPTPTFATKPWTTSSRMRVELPQSHIVGQQRQQISELQFDKFPNPQSFLVWKFGSKLKWQLVLIFHRMLCCGSRTWRWWPRDGVTMACA